MPKGPMPSKRKATYALNVKVRESRKVSFPALPDHNEGLPLAELLKVFGVLGLFCVVGLFG